MDQDGQRDSATPDSLQRKRAIRRGVIAALALTVAGVFLVLPGITTVQADYYLRFPEVRESIYYWEESTHSLMTCASCHIEPGLWGHISYGLRAIPAFYSQLFVGPGEENLFDAPPTHSCLRCHTIDRVVSADGDLLIPHRAHIETLGIECVDCHVRLVHYDNPLGLNRPPMEMCMETCHDGVRAGEECTECHTRIDVPDDHLQPDWLQVHQQESEKQDCGECHGWTPDYCAQCHQERPRSHEGNFRTLHSERAAVNSEGCMFCHEEQFCLNCH